MKMRRIAALVLAALLLLPGLLPVQADAEENEGEKFNIIIVTDCSGSLTAVDGNYSDPDGYRYDAISMFLNLLTESGNNVGAIVFNSTTSMTDTSDATMLEGLRLDTGLLPMNSRDDKDALMKKIEAVTPWGYTDIGTALLQAAHELNGVTAENGLRSIIVLFTDGITETKDKYLNPDLPDAQLPVYLKSQANSSEAVELIRSNDITLCGVYLSGKRGKLDNSEVLTLVRDANGYSENASAEQVEEYIPVKEADSLADAYKQFFTMITGTSASAFEGTKEFTVPGAGVSDLNVNLLVQAPTLEQSKQIVDQITLTVQRPDQSIVSSRDLIMSKGDTYMVYKIPNPEKGVWRVKVNAPAGAQVESSLLISSDVSARMTVSKDSTDYVINQPITVKGQLFRGDTPLEGADAYDGYQCFLELKESNGDREWKVPMTYQSGDNAFVCRVSQEYYGNYTARVVFECDNAIRLESKADTWAFHNTKPDAPEKLDVPVVLSMFSQGVAEVDLRALVTDRDDHTDEIVIALNKAKYTPDGCRQEGDTLIIDGVIGGSGTVYVSFTDTGDETSVMEVNIVYTDKAKGQIAMILAALLALLLLFVAIKLKNRVSAKLEGTLTVELPVGGTVLALRLTAQNCLNRNMGGILSDYRTELAMLAAKRGCAADCVDRFLEMYTKQLSAIKISTVHDKQTGTDLCRVSGLPGSEPVKDLCDKKEITLQLTDLATPVRLRYNRFL